MDFETLYNNIQDANIEWDHQFTSETVTYWEGRLMVDPQTIKNNLIVSKMNWLYQGDND